MNNLKNLFKKVSILKSNKFIITGLLCTALFITAIHPDVNAQTKNLRYYIDCAVNSDPVIQENTNLLNTGIIRKELIYSQYKKPHIFGTANYLFAPAFGEYSYDSSITNGGLYSALINLEMPLFTGFSSSAKLEDINNDLTSYSNTILITRHEIEKNVTAQYYKVFQGQQQIAAIDEILKILDYQKEIVKAMADRSIGKISDVTLLEIEYQSQIIAKSNLTQTLETDLMDLNLLAGINDTAIVVLEDPGIKLTSDVENKSNFLLTYTLDSLKIITEKKLNESNYKPQVALFINGGLNAVSYNEIWKKVGISTGFNITFDIYNGGQRDLNNKLADIKKVNLSNNKTMFLEQNSQRKRYLLKEIEGLNKLLEPLEKQLENYRLLLDLYRDEFVAGEVSLLDYINILKSYITFKNEIINNKNQQATIINEFNYWNW